MEKLHLTYADPADLQENPWNPNEMDAINEGKLENSIDELGFVSPIKVRELEDGTLQIIGGQHRSRYALRNNMNQVPVINFGRISDDMAQKIGLVDNGRYGEDNLDKLNALFVEAGWSQDEIINIMPMDESDFENIFAHSTEELDLDDLMGGIEDEEQDAEAAVIDTDMPAVKTHQIMRFKVPVEDAPAIQAFISRLQREQGFTDSDQLTNAGDALVYGLGTHPEFDRD